MNMKLEQVLSPANCVSAREELNLSQAKVASDTGISRPYLSQFESGKRVLEDAKQQDLLDYYEDQGWERPIAASDVEPEVLPFVLRDGFVVIDSIDEVDLEGILAEYCDNAERIEKLKATEIRRGSWSGNIDLDHAHTEWLKVMMLSARQCTIKRLLHGQADVSGEFVEQDREAISTIGEYGDDMFYRCFVKGDDLYFRV